MKMKVCYPAIIKKEGTEYLVEFPDLDGCFTYGNSLADALTMGEDALGLYIASLLENEKKIPEPSSIDTLKCKKDEVCNYIAADLVNHLRGTETTNKTLTLPKWLDQMSKEYNISASKVLQRALISEINMIEDKKDDDYKV